MRTGRTYPSAWLLCCSVVHIHINLPASAAACMAADLELRFELRFELQFWPMVLAGQDGQPVLDGGPAMLTHAFSQPSLSAFPERQCCNEGCASRWGECQNVASVSPLRSELYIASLFKWSQIARQGRSLHLQRIRQRLDRERTAGANRCQHGYLCCTEPRRSKCIVIRAGNNAGSHACLVTHAGIKKHLRQRRGGCLLSHVVHIHYMSALSIGFRVRRGLNRPHFADLDRPPRALAMCALFVGTRLSSDVEAAVAEEGDRRLRRCHRRGK